MKDLAIRFESGKDVLNAYWGYLSDGGLVIPDAEHLSVGEPVSLNVLIASASARYSLSGRVVRRDADAGRAVIAFAPGQPHDMLLTQALADADKVPARRSRRFRVDLEAQVRLADEDAAPAPARLVDLSEHGCCLRLADRDALPFAVGRPVDIAAGAFAAGGRIVWTRRDERGVVFSPGDGAAADAPALEPVRRFLRTLGR